MAPRADDLHVVLRQEVRAAGDRFRGNGMDGEGSGRYLVPDQQRELDLLVIALADEFKSVPAVRIIPLSTRKIIHRTIFVTTIIRLTYIPIFVH